MRAPSWWANREAISEVGGIVGHRLRRIVHLTLVVIPFLYYDVLAPLCAWFGWSHQWVAIAIGGSLLGFDIARIVTGFHVWGQRPYEERRLSGLGYAVLGALAVLLLLRDSRAVSAKAYAVPIFGVAGLVDPLLGELRARGWELAARYAVGWLTAALLWCVSSWCFGTPWICTVLIPGLVLIGEGRQYRLLDDNFTNFVLPLLAVQFLRLIGPDSF
jgi:hypothetical protein